MTEIELKGELGFVEFLEEGQVGTPGWEQMTLKKNQAILVPGRECGSCTLCCKYPPPELKKPGGGWCQHCAPGKGCSIYKSRPFTCKAFFCGYRIYDWLGEEWYPPHSNMVIYGTARGWTIDVQAGAEGKWREPLYLRTLQALSRKGLDGKVKVRVRVHEESKQWIVLPDMVVEDGYLLIVPMGTDQHGQTVWKPVRFNDAESMRRTYDLLYCGRRDLLVVLPFKANSNHLTSTWINQAFSDSRIAGSRSPQT